MQFLKIYICAILVLFTFNQLHAVGTPKVLAAVDKSEQDTVLIGDWVKLRLQAEFEEDISMSWPAFEQKIGAFEVVEISDIDTTKQGTNIQLRQDITLAAFDSGHFEIPPINFDYTHKRKKNIKGKITTQAITVPIYSLNIDPEEDILTIKETLGVPLTFREKMTYVLMALGGLLALALIFFLVRRFLRQEEEQEVKEEIKLPAHEIALKKLQVLENERSWQRGQTKKYYTDLTDIVREYIENRYEIPAMEQTTDEIITALRKRQVSKKVCNKLREMLSLADMVKFAKSKPSVDVNNQSFVDADFFIRKTKEMEELLAEVQES